MGERRLGSQRLEVGAKGLVGASRAKRHEQVFCQQFAEGRPERFRIKSDHGALLAYCPLSIVIMARMNRAFQCAFLRTGVCQWRTLQAISVASRNLTWKGCTR